MTWLSSAQIAQSSEMIKFVCLGLAIQKWDGDDQNLAQCEGTIFKSLQLRNCQGLQDAHTGEDQEWQSHVTTVET
ncbi:hypothetical protein FRX31_014274 [Thalictrum thalictroides]|uniref:Uncharacterized protein n=1 Tax=Thalictrum thalictroides TaxID=46969 RepID=A0A7J6WGU8_THATH|nr:hypothetical protein FRX31_014274 [Thalictrum thalictroides]